jgi:hypothetical protein
MHFRIGFASAISCLALLLGLFTFVGTASAHTTNNARDVHPEINIDNSQAGSFSNCVTISLSGSGFTASKGSHHNHALISARDDNGDDLSVDPSSIRVGGDGSFSESINVCGVSHTQPIMFCPGVQFGGCRFIQAAPSLITVSAEDEATGASSNDASLEITFS